MMKFKIFSHFLIISVEPFFFRKIFMIFFKLKILEDEVKLIFILELIKILTISSNLTPVVLRNILNGINLYRFDIINIYNYIWGVFLNENPIKYNLKIIEQ